MEQAETEMLSVLRTNSPNYRLDYLYYAPSIECMYAMRKGARARSEAANALFIFARSLCLDWRFFIY